MDSRNNIINKIKTFQDDLTHFLQTGGAKKKKPKEKNLNEMTKGELESYFTEFIKTVSLESEIFAEWSKNMSRLEKEALVDTPSYLYPHLLDSNFNKKIASKKEFNDTQYDQEIYSVKEHSEKVCEDAEFELMPHQMFVRNFLSFQTPYNNLLLYHGLGTGKTCSAISVCEEMRDYLNQIGIAKRIIIVASPNVQDNFKLQLFDERKLENNNGLWSMKACSGNKFLNEINPMKMKGFTKKKIIKQVNQIIRSSYLFLGYEQFSIYIG